MADPINLLKNVAQAPGRTEVLYVNSLLLDTLFVHQFGGVTKFLQSIEETTEVALEAQAGVGLGGALLKLFLEIKASITAEGKIGEQTKMIVEKELTLSHRVRLCEASLEDAGAIKDNPPSSEHAFGKLLRLTDCMSMFDRGDEGALSKELGEDAAQSILARWDRDQRLTPNSPQVLLATQQPFTMAAIIMFQSGLDGSTYIGYPPPGNASRSVLAEPLFQEEGVTFLKTYWVIDKYSQ